LVAVYDRQDKQADFASSIAELRRRLAYGHSVAVVDLADPIRRVKRAFARLVEPT
jgi:hypothetical protein